MADEPREYDREYMTPLSHRTRRRVGYSHDRCTVTRFVVQLEYRLDDEWVTVVRYDHDAGGADDMAHDVTEGGLHMDIYRDGEKVDVEQLTGPLPAGVALDSAGEHLTTHHEQFTERFEQWHTTDQNGR